MRNKILLLHEDREIWLKRIKRSPQWRQRRSIATQKKDYSERKKKRENTWQVSCAWLTCSGIRQSSCQRIASSIIKFYEHRDSGIISRIHEFDLSHGLINIRSHTYFNDINLTANIARVLSSKWLILHNITA